MDSFLGGVDQSQRYENDRFSFADEHSDITPEVEQVRCEISSSHARVFDRLHFQRSTGTVTWSRCLTWTSDANVSLKNYMIELSPCFAAMIYKIKSCTFFNHIITTSSALIQ
jgi:hypothetical protein